MNTSATIALRLPENAAALADLESRRQALLAVMHTKTENVPAGAPNGSTGLFAAIGEINLAIANLIHTDLVTGTRWTR